MSARLTFRLAAAGFALLVLLVATAQARRTTAQRPAAPPPLQAAAPQRTDLARCQALGAAGAEDPDCLRAWDEARARFLGRGGR